jgi:signal transduction histidine kinase
VLSKFIVSHRGEIIARAQARAKARSVPPSIEAKVRNGVPLFLTQLVDALATAAHARDPRSPTEAEARSTRILDSASMHGRELLEQGFTVPQVVHGYGDVCQVVTELAHELDSKITNSDFHEFNRCLDDAIAGAVTAYVEQREQALAFEGTERLGVLAHEMRNLLNTAVLSFDVLKSGTVGFGGSTAALHARSLAGLRALVERSLAEVRLDAGKPSRDRVSLAELFEETEVIASLHADGHGVQLRSECDESDAFIDVDRQLITSAVSNVLQNAFKFTPPEGTVSFSARSTEDRVLIEIGDECGGLTPGAAEAMFHPFSPVKTAGSGLGLGLSIARRATEANAGRLVVRDVPGTGCVFTIDLPRAAG